MREKSERYFVIYDTDDGGRVHGSTNERKEASRIAKELEGLIGVTVRLFGLSTFRIGEGMPWKLVGHVNASMRIAIVGSITDEDDPDNLREVVPALDEDDEPYEEFNPNVFTSGTNDGEGGFPIYALLGDNGSPVKLLIDLSGKADMLNPTAEDLVNA